MIAFSPLYPDERPEPFDPEKFKTLQKLRDEYYTLMIQLGAATGEDWRLKVMAQESAVAKATGRKAVNQWNEADLEKHIRVARRRLDEVQERNTSNEHRDY